MKRQTLNMKADSIEDDELSPVEGGSKYSPEQVAYLDQCAIAAMREVISSQYYKHVKTVVEITDLAYDIAEAMLQEKERRVKG